MYLLKFCNLVNFKTNFNITTAVLAQIKKFIERLYHLHTPNLEVMIHLLTMKESLHKLFKFQFGGT